MMNDGNYCDEDENSYPSHLDVNNLQKLDKTGLIFVVFLVDLPVIHFALCIIRNTKIRFDTIWSTLCNIIASTCNIYK